MENTYLLTDSFATQRHTQFLTTMETYDQAELPPLIIDLKRVNTTLKANRWQNNKDIILACVALKQKCSTGVGKWLRENCHNIDDRQKAQIAEKCKWAASIYKNWEKIVHNLTARGMKNVDPQNYSLRNLYDAAGEAWCKRERKRNNRERKQRSDSQPTQDYEENKYLELREKVITSRILHDVSFDREQAEMIIDRLNEDLQKMCDEAQE